VRRHGDGGRRKKRGRVGVWCVVVRWRKEWKKGEKREAQRCAARLREGEGGVEVERVGGRSVGRGRRRRKDRIG